MSGELEAAMPSDSESVRRQLRAAGITKRAINAVWPAWWSSEAESSFSATTELKYTLARRLGISPASLFEGPPKFVWKDDAKFKNLGTESEEQRAILASFGVAVGRCAIAASGGRDELPPAVTAQYLRGAILESSELIGLFEILTFCWGVGIPVLKISLFPLARKRMHAMTVRVGDRHAVLIGRESRFPSQTAYAVAHEIGHIVLHHVADSAALLEVQDPLQVKERDDEEAAADRFALELLTGEPTPRVEADRADFTARQLAHAAAEASADRRIDAGVLALCLGHATGRWRQAFGALKVIPPGEMDVGAMINQIAQSQIDWSALSLDNKDYLDAVMDGVREH